MNCKISNRIILWNARSIKHHIPNIELQLNGSEMQTLPAMMCFTETWQHPEHKLTTIDNYQWYTQPKSNGYGGLAILIHKSIPCQAINHIPKIQSTTSTDIMWIKIKLQNNPESIIGLTYFTPQIDQTSLNNCIFNIECALSIELPVILLGDFNMHHSDWNETISTSTAPNSQTNRFVDFCYTHDLYCLNPIHIPNQSTRININQNQLINSQPDSNNSQNLTKHKQSIIDLIITSNPEIITSIHISPTWNEILTSDHVVLSIQLIHNTNKNPPISLNNVENEQVKISWNVDFKKEEWQQSLPAEYDFQLHKHNFPFNLENILINQPNHNPNMIQQILNNTYNTFINIIHDSCANIVGIKQIRKNQQKSWFNFPGVKMKFQQIKSFKKLINKYQKRNLQVEQSSDSNSRNNSAQFETELKELKTQYNKCFNEWKNIIRKAKDESWHSFCNEIQNDPNGTLLWKNVKKSIPKQFGSHNSFNNITGCLPKDTRQSLNNITNYFINSAIPKQIINNNNIHLDNIETEIDESDNWIFTVEEITETCRFYRQNTAPGPDNILPHFLKYGSELLYNALTVIFNVSWKYGILPQQWKDANVFAMYKQKGDIQQPSSYRPISITSIVIRIFEHLIHKRLIGRIEQLNILDKYQFGFRHKHSCYDAIHSILQTIKEHINVNHKILPVAFLDLTKAFDKVYHNILLNYLLKIGIKGKAWNWIRNFLENRRIRTINNNTASEWHKITYGVPQGSVLSPLLFLLYINTAAAEIRLKCPNVNIILYADDIAIHPIITKHAIYQKRFQQFQQALDILTTWSNDHGMEFSAEKSQIVVFNKKQNVDYNGLQLNQFKLSNFTLDIVDHYKYLGIWLHKSLNWKQQQNKCCKQSLWDGYLISRLFHNNRGPFIKAAKILSNTFIRSRCTYGIEFWDINDSTTRKIQSALINPIRKSLSLPKTSHQLGTIIESSIFTLNVFKQYRQIRYIKRLAELPDSHPVKIRFNNDLLSYKSKIYPQTKIETITQKFTINHDNLKILTDWFNINEIEEIKSLSYNEIKKKAHEKTFDEYKNDNSHQTTALLFEIKHSSTKTTYTSDHDYHAIKIKAKLRNNRALTEQIKKRFKFDNTTNDKCLKCTNKIETVKHILMECELYNRLRNQLNTQLKKIMLKYKQSNLSPEIILGEKNFKNNTKINNDDYKIIQLKSNQFLKSLCKTRRTKYKMNFP
jgi:hypothetical protein